MSKHGLKPFEMLIRVTYQPHNESYGYNVTGEGVARIGGIKKPIKVYVGLLYTDANRVMTSFSLEIRADDLSDEIKRANRPDPIAQLEEPKKKS